MSANRLAYVIRNQYIAALQGAPDIDYRDKRRARKLVRKLAKMRHEPVRATYLSFVR